MNVWINKLSAEIVLATPHWEPIRIDFDENFYNDLVPELKLFAKNKKVVHGCLIQVGWLIQNKHGLWFGVNFKAEDNFIDLGEA